MTAIAYPLALIGLLIVACVDWTRYVPSERQDVPDIW